MHLTIPAAVRGQRQLARWLLRAASLMVIDGTIVTVALPSIQRHLGFSARRTPTVKAVVFMIVQQGLFGLDLGCSFAPNHKACPSWTPATAVTSCAVRCSLRATCAAAG